MVDAVCVTSATITGVTNGTSVDPDIVTSITCTADDKAYPSASYRWTNEVDGSQSTVQSGPQFVLSPGTQYKLTCFASNNFDRSGCYATDSVEFHSKLLLHVYCLVMKL